MEIKLFSPGRSLSLFFAKLSGFFQKNNKYKTPFWVSQCMCGVCLYQILLSIKAGFTSDKKNKE
jgi:hypothetical protein